MKAHTMMHENPRKFGETFVQSLKCVHSRDTSQFCKLKAL